MATLVRDAPARLDAAGHLREELAVLDLLLRRQILRLRAARLLTDDELRGLYITDAQADALLDGGAGGRTDGSADGDWPARLGAADDAVEAARGALDARVAAAERAGAELPLAHLARLFGLSRCERQALLVVIAPSLDLRYETLYAYAQNDVTRRRPRLDLVGRLVDAARDGGAAGARALVAADAPLVRHRLVRLVDDPQDRDPPLPARALAADERIVDWLLGDRALDRRLDGVARLDGAVGGGGGGEPAAAAQVAPEWRAALARALRAVRPRGGAVYLHGPPGAGKGAAARAVCAELGLPLLRLDLAAAPQAPAAAVAELLELAVREAALQDAALYVSRADGLVAGEPRGERLDERLLRYAAALRRPLLLGGTEPWPAPAAAGRPPVVAVACALPDAPRREELWRRALARAGQGAGAAATTATAADLPALAERFALGPSQIGAAAEEAVLRAAARGAAAPEPADLFAAARGQSGAGLASLARRLQTPYRWADLVLPPRAMQQLQEVRAAVRHRGLVLDGWGFAARHGTSRGLNVLFAGPSGTGKTMAAQILAGDARLDVYRIDLAAVVSKYIGETEKNLDRIFAAARSSNAMLFFDEADALFGKRSEVRDAHDRYANIEVAYLLQRMEDYDGVAILATNLRRNIDEAFARRIHHAVEFPVPDAADRERLWRGMLPPAAPLAADIDLPFLARQFELAGGHIRNVVLAAAFLAAEERASLGMRQLLLGVARELQKLGRMPSRAEFREHYDLIRERG